MSAQMAEIGLDLNLGDLFYAGRRHSVVDYLADLSWDVSSRPRRDVRRLRATLPHRPGGPGAG